MISDKTKKELYSQLRQAILLYDDRRVVELCGQVLIEELDPMQAILEGLAAGMVDAGDRYQTGDYFVPELLLCSDALYAGLDILQPHVASNRPSTSSGKIILGVVEGDIHDIGKNLLKAMFTATGWKVHDLGKDVTCRTFTEAQQAVQADVVGLSALMATSMMAMPDIIEGLRGVSPELKIMVGGAPLNAEVAEKFGADGYAHNAVAAVGEAERLLSMVSVRQ